MGYHLSILRTNGKQNIPIDQMEIESLPGAFPEWQFDTKQIALVSVDDRDDAPALWFTDGQLWTTNPSDETIASMITLANKLGARVRGDEFETYRTVNETYVHPDDMETLGELQSESKSLAKSSKLRSLLFRVLAALAGILVAFALHKLRVTK